MSKNARNIVISVACALLVVALAVGGYLLYQKYKPTTEIGTKTVMLTVRDTVHGKQDRDLVIKTEAATLADLLTENGIAEYETGEYGTYIVAVDGVSADEAKHEFWSIYVNGEFGTLGAQLQPVYDGDTFTLSLETY